MKQPPLSARPLQPLSAEYDAFCRARARRVGGAGEGAEPLRDLAVSMVDAPTDWHVLQLLGQCVADESVVWSADVLDALLGGVPAEAACIVAARGASVLPRGVGLCAKHVDTALAQVASAPPVLRQQLGAEAMLMLGAAWTGARAAADEGEMTSLLTKDTAASLFRAACADGTASLAIEVVRHMRSLADNHTGTMTLGVYRSLARVLSRAGALGEARALLDEFGTCSGDGAAAGAFVEALAAGARDAGYGMTPGRTVADPALYRAMGAALRRVGRARQAVRMADALAVTGNAGLRPFCEGGRLFTRLGLEMVRSNRVQEAVILAEALAEGGGTPTADAGTVARANEDAGGRTGDGGDGDGGLRHFCKALVHELVPRSLAHARRRARGGVAGATGAGDAVGSTPPRLPWRDSPGALRQLFGVVEQALRAHPADAPWYARQGQRLVRTGLVDEATLLAERMQAAGAAQAHLEPLVEALLGACERGELDVGGEEAVSRVNGILVAANEAAAQRNSIALRELHSGNVDGALVMLGEMSADGVRPSAELVCAAIDALWAGGRRAEALEYTEIFAELRYPAVGVSTEVSGRGLQLSLDGCTPRVAVARLLVWLRSEVPPPGVQPTGYLIALAESNLQVRARALCSGARE